MTTQASPDQSATTKDRDERGAAGPDPWWRVSRWGAAAMEVEFEAGVYEVYCAVPGHGNMELELVVEG